MGGVRVKGVWLSGVVVWSVVVVGLVRGQPVVERDQMPVPGMYVVYWIDADDVLKEDVITPGGGGFHWNFSFLRRERIDTVRFFLPENTPFYYQFRGSTYSTMILMSRDNVDTFFLYLRREDGESASCDWLAGVGTIFRTQAIVDALGGNVALGVPIQEACFMKTPLRYGETFQDQGIYVIEGQEGKRIQVDVQDVADAWGWLTLPDSAPVYVMRIHRIVDFKVQARLFGVWTTLHRLTVEEYFFYDTVNPFPRMRVHVNRSSDTLYSVRFYDSYGEVDSKLVSYYRFWRVFRRGDWVYVLHPMGLLPASIRVYDIAGRCVARVVRGNRVYLPVRGWYAIEVWMGEEVMRIPFFSP